MAAHGRAAWVVGALVAAGAAAPAAAIDLERLISPGPLAEAHARAEADCGNCHAPGEGLASERRLCLVCHEDVEADLAARRGFHGLDPRVGVDSCRACHPEHRGREADLLALDVDAFDHERTDFPLRGAHADLACAGCHAPDEAHRKAPSDCATCHGADDVHAGGMGSDCADCHRPESWREGRFDHEATRFPLRGRHRDADCGLCHPGRRYQGTPTRCQDCHGLDDAHGGRFGPDCGQCHQSRGWQLALFDHAKQTRFALTGAHREARCESCHTAPLQKQRLDMRCVSCHRSDDSHRGTNGTACESCHGSVTWARSSFDHEAASGFALTGQHAQLECRTCHRGDVYEDDVETRCAGCHRADDAHHGQLGDDCDGCHDPGGWEDEVFFDHDLTRFPLLGLHAAVTCEDCHAKATFKDADPACVSCHRTADVHGLRLGPDCGACHNPNSWQAWRFDHDTRTAFALHASHASLQCERCHEQPMPKAVRLSSSCYACHALDDAHRGAFGRDCERCHDEEAWSHARFPR